MNNNREPFTIVEHVITLLLFICVFSLLRAILAGYFIVAVVCLIIGFCVSWLLRATAIPQIRNVIAIFPVGVAAWLGYSIVVSTLAFRDIVIICIKGISILCIILSMFTFIPFVLNCIQILSVPLVFSYALVALKPNEIPYPFLLSYFCLWFILMRIKLLKVCRPQMAEAQTARSVYVAAVLVVGIMILSTGLHAAFLAQGPATEGVFMGEGTTWGGNDLEQERYRLLKELQGMVSQSIGGMPRVDDRKQSVGFMSSLTKETADSMEIDEAQEGLVSKMNTPGLGMEEGKGREFTSTMDKFAGNSIALNQQRSKNELDDTIRKNLFDLQKRLQAARKMRKISQSKTPEELNDAEQDMQKQLDSFPQAGGRTTETLQAMSDFKAYQMYRAYRQEAQKRLEDTPEPKPSGVSEVLNALANMTTLKDYETVEQSVKQLSEEKKVETKIASALSRALDARLLMLRQNTQDTVRQTMVNQDMPLPEVRELMQHFSETRSAENAGAFFQAVTKLEEAFEAKEVPVPEPVTDALRVQAYLLLKDYIERIARIFKEKAALTAPEKEFLATLGGLPSLDTAEAIDAQVANMQRQTDTFAGMGLVKEAQKVVIQDSLVSIQRILSFLKTGLHESKKPAQETISSGIEDAQIQAMDIPDEVKQTVQRLASMVWQAQTMQELLEVQEVIQRQIDDLKKTLASEKVKKIEAYLNNVVHIKRDTIIQQAIAELKNQIKTLKELGKKEEAEALAERLESIESSSNQQQLQESVVSLENYTHSSEFRKMENQENTTVERKAYAVYLSPVPPVMAAGSTLQVKVFAVYKNSMLLDVTKDSDVVVIPPEVIRADAEGRLTAVAVGRAEISASYKNSVSVAISVVGADTLNEQVSEQVWSSAQ